MSTLVLKNRFN